MSQSTVGEEASGSEQAPPAQSSTTELSGDGTVLLRKSCDLCVRLKRACDGKNPCHLCLRRRENCTRSVKRKSGPAKGTKYTTRRQRLEAGIVDPPQPKSKAKKALTKANAVSSDGRGGSSGKGKAAGMGYAVPAPPTAANASAGAPGRKGAKHNNHSKASAQSLSGMSQLPETLQPPAMSREEYRPAVASGAAAVGLGEGRAPAGRGGRRSDPGTRILSPPSLAAEVTAGLSGGSGRAENNGGEIRGNGGGGTPEGTASHSSLSPLYMPVLPSWHSPSMGGTAAPEVGGEYGRTSLAGGRRSASPFGLLSGPPPALAGKPRRGGTREPPVVAGAGPGHFRAPSGPPSSKRFRMSPPFPPRDAIPGQRTADDGHAGAAMSGSADGEGSSGSGGGGYRSGSTRRDGRKFYADGGVAAPFMGGVAPFSSAVPFSTSQPATVGSFDSSNALGAILDGRHGSSNGIRGAGRGGNRARNAGTKGTVGFHGDADSAATAAYGRQHVGWDQARTRHLPRPASSAAAGGGYSRMDGADSRWRQMDESGERDGGAGVGRWRGGQRQHHHQYQQQQQQQQQQQHQQHHENNGGFGAGGGSGNGRGGIVSRGAVIDSTRDLLADATAGTHEAGWGIARTVFSGGHSNDHDVDGGGSGDRSRPWDAGGEGGGGALQSSDRHALVNIGTGDNGVRGGAGGTSGGGGDGRSGERADWGFNPNSPLPSSRSNNGNTGSNGMDGACGSRRGGSDGSSGDMSANALASAAVTATASGNNGGGGVWPEDTLTLPSPVYSPVAPEGILQRGQYRRQYLPQEQPGRTSAMPLPTTGGGGGAGSSGGGGGGDGSYHTGPPTSPMWTGASGRQSGSSGVTEAPQRAASPSPTYFRSASITGPGAIAPGADDSWGGGNGNRDDEGSVGGGGGGSGVSEGCSQFLDPGGNSARDRDQSPRNTGGNLGSGVGWQGPWGGLQGQRAVFEREGAWNSQYSI